VRDLSRARELFVGVLGGLPFHEQTRTERNTHSLFVSIGTESVIELAMPLQGESPLAPELDKNGEMLHSATFRVPDLARAEHHLRSCGLRPYRDGSSLWLDPSQAFGAVYGFTDRDLPEDPRGSAGVRER
jgi:hypothetical protein